MTDLHRFCDNVISFESDAITCSQNGDDNLRAIACGLTMQRTMGRLALWSVDGGCDKRHIDLRAARPQVNPVPPE
jgi:hypothetical protein